MTAIPRQAIIFLMVAALVLVPFGTAGLAQDQAEKKEGPKAISMVGDLALARPIGFVTTIVGSVLFILALPFTAIGGKTGEAGKRLVLEPAKYTFKRPLGDFSENWNE